jgi:hypothetical protein
MMTFVAVTYATRLLMLHGRDVLEAAGACYKRGGVGQKLLFHAFHVFPPTPTW